MSDALMTSGHPLYLGAAGNVLIVVGLLWIAWILWWPDRR